jgi:hypothetical protein
MRPSSTATSRSRPPASGVLTNGVVYRFFSDLEAPNKMDSRPFLEVNLLAVDDLIFAELKKFSKGQLRGGRHSRQRPQVHPRDQAHPQPGAQPAVRGVRPLLHRAGLSRPHDPDHPRAAHRDHPEGTPAVHQREGERSLKFALAQEQEATKAAAPVEEAAAEQGPTLETTAEEMQACYIVQAILAQTEIYRQATMLRETVDRYENAKTPTEPPPAP